MRKLLALLFIITLSFTLWSCAFGQECTEHIDENGDLKCDNCEAELECTDHVDTKVDGTYKCDKCGANMKCKSHVDADKNLKCDNCGATVRCTDHVDTKVNGTYECDICGAEMECTEHVDANRDLKCDKCSEDVECTHIDVNNDGICDVAKCKWNYNHTHTYDWAADATKHWKAPTCGHSVPATDEADHTDADNNGICDVCSYSLCAHTEFESEGWESDESGHWRPLTCGHNVKPDVSHVEAHDFSKITADGVFCSKCDYEEGHEHGYDSEWSTTETEHWHKSNCGHDTVEQNRGAHVDEAPYDGKCDVCEYTMCECGYYDDWYYDNDKHWHEPKCDHLEKKDEGLHEDANNDGLCDGCSWNYGHEHTYEWVKDENGHKKVATCGHTVSDIEVGAHIDANGDILCDTCEYNYGHEHNVSTDWSSNETHHWHAVIGDCATAHPDIKLDYTEHTDIDDSGRCDVCGAPYIANPSIPEGSDDNPIDTPKLETTP